MIGVHSYYSRSKMFPSAPCYICQETDHKPVNCPELYSDLKEPGHPQPSGPRGQDDD
jgi:hypothetical protein